MDEVVDLLNEILDELRTMNEKLDDIRGNEYSDGSLEDIFSKLDDIDDSIKYFIENNYLENNEKLTLILPREIALEKEFLNELKLKIEIPKI